MGVSISPGLSPPGPFRGFAPFDESAADVFFGRSLEAAAVLERVLSQNGRVVTLTGESGVGKTSLVRAGVIPVLQKRGVPVLYLPDPTNVDAEVFRAGDGASPPLAEETSSDYVARLARESRAGMVMVLDHLETVLGDDASPGTANALSIFVTQVLEGAAGKVHLVLALDSDMFTRLDRLVLPLPFRPAGGFWYTLQRLDETTVAEILERTAVHAGTQLEAGLPAQIAADLCREERCLPVDLQLCARAMVDFRVTSTRRYQSSGGVGTLRAMFFDHALEHAPPGSRRVLLEVAAQPGAASLTDLEARTGLPDAAVAESVNALVERGVLRRWTFDPEERFGLAHAALRPYVESYGIEDRARAETVRRRLRARMIQGGRLNFRDVVAVHRVLGAALSPSERALFLGSVRRHLIQLSVVAGLLIVLGATMAIGSRAGYVLAFDPPGQDAASRAIAASRVVVRRGRPRGGLSGLFSRSAASDPIIADTGFSAAGMVPASTARIAAGQAGGTLDPSPPGGVPSWLREVVNGLRPVPRGVAKENPCFNFRETVIQH